MREKPKRTAKRTFSPANPLEAALEFTEEDLEDNRAGYLSQVQIKYYEGLISPRYWLVFLFPYVIYFFILTPFLLGVRSLEELIDILSFIIWFSVCLSIFSFPISILMILDKGKFRKRISHDLRAGKVQITYGRVFLRFKANRSSKGDIYYWGGLKFRLMTLIKVGDEQLLTTYKSAYLFNDSFYAVYYLPQTKLVVSAEKYTATQHRDHKIKHAS